MSDLHFDGQTVVVTGGTGGIGSAVGLMFLERGAIVYAIDAAGSPPAGVRFARADVTKPAEVDAAIHAVIQETGRLDALVVCAGVTRDRMLWKLSDEDWRGVLAVNLDGAFHALRAAAPAMRERRSGAVVLVSSINGERGKAGQANYAASKAGLIGLARTAARELGPSGIRVNVVSPGFTETSMTSALPDNIKEAAAAEAALGGASGPRDVAGAVLFLCSGLARRITGQVLRVDGGQYM